MFTKTREDKIGESSNQWIQIHITSSHCSYNKQRTTQSLPRLLFPALLVLRALFGGDVAEAQEIAALGIRGKADACSLWGRAALEMVAVCYRYPLFPCFRRFALATACQCNSSESFLFFFFSSQLSFKYLLCYLGFFNVHERKEGRAWQQPRRVSRKHSCW